MSTSGEVTVRRIVPADWPQTKAFRLEALEDTPIGFLETLATARTLPDDVWRARAARGAEGGDSFQLLAVSDGRAAGTCVCFLEDGTAWLAAVYLSPTYRGVGLLGRLVEQCAGWAVSHGAPQLHLEVHEDNRRARRAYAKLGFTETGHRRPYPLDPGGEELEMVRSLR